MMFLNLSPLSSSLDQQLESFRNKLEEAFDSDSSKQDRSVKWIPSAELIDTPDALLLAIQLPGVDRKDVEVNIANEAVSVSGERQYLNGKSDRTCLGSEFSYGKFHRIIPLPAAVQKDKTTANFTDGILTLTLPKIAEERVVKLNLAEAAGATSDNILESAKA